MSFDLSTVTLTKSLISAVLCEEIPDSPNKIEIGNKILRRLSELENERRRVQSIEEQRQDLTEKFEKQMEALMKQQGCKHEYTRRTGGMPDGDRVCLLCEQFV